MKRKNFFILGALSLCLSLQSCSNCGPMSKADLMHAVSSFDLAPIVGSGSGAGAMLGIASSFLNVAESVSKRCDCNETTVSADNQAVKWRVQHSNDGKVPSGEQTLVDENESKSSLEACVNEKCSTKAGGFLNNSFYIITNILDFLTNVDERNEGNNNQSGLKNTPVMSAAELFKYEKAFYGNNFKSEVIYIDNDYGVYRVDEKGVKTFLFNL